jgi:SAM-dependent methyltransferase
MKIVTGKAQDRYWQGTSYRDGSDPLSRAYADPKIEYVLKLADLRGLRVLDVGCGTGVFTLPLRAVASRVIGLDYSAHMLRKNAVRTLVQGDASALPFGADAFDAVFSANLLHHSDEPAQLLGEMIRVSRNYVILVEPNRYNPLMFAFGVLVREERGLLRSSTSYIATLMRSRGLSVIRCKAMGMISQNNTPGGLVPFLKRFDRECCYGEYVVGVAAKA